ncbi:C10 family peptidase [Tichowtungia aerotolerans]|uniref:Spi protease inhibitor domain-containing protein n=1 Tax=Tichowtungia aerotolerans TaxID=2697043 RepID=A0A6P1M944_9BACT|nr:C10 family peptidase [Tichowtungia aerotolerans]QHI70411.1 hypothetical protein GT409_13510 [Tichowtungia aerotolerans]
MSAVWAETISQDEALEYGRNWLGLQADSLSSNSVSVAASAEPDIVIVTYTLKDSSGTPTVYVLDAASQGFLILSADDRVQPVLGYGDKLPENSEIPPNVKYWLQSMSAQIEVVRASAGTSVHSGWSDPTVSRVAAVAATDASSGDIGPLLQTAWHQGDFYNAYCPADPDATTGNGLTWAGCVATAMAQVMRYYEYPFRGRYSFAYEDERYGTQSENFGQHIYNWTNMPNQLTATNLDVCRLIRDCGVAVKMIYGPDSSGSYTRSVLDAMALYFGYSIHANMVVRMASGEESESWKTMLLNELIAARPVFYAGKQPDNQSGHAFVCDGYRASDDTFHFNWGWRGYYNGYYSVNDLSPSSVDYNGRQYMLLGLQPQSPMPNVLLLSRNGAGTWERVVDANEDGIKLKDNAVEPSSDYFIEIVSSGGSHSDWLISSELYIPPGTHASLEFDYLAYMGPSSLRVFVSTHAGNSVDLFTNQVAERVESSGMAAPDHCSVSLNDYAGQTLRIGVEVYETSAYTIMDNFAVYSTVPVTVVGAGHGTVRPDDVVEIPYLHDGQFDVEADPYYHIASIVTNGQKWADDSILSGIPQTNLVWSQLTTASTMTVCFAENTAPAGTPEWWLAEHGLTNDAVAVEESNDQDGDGFSACDEFIAGTVPTDPQSRFYASSCTSVAGGQWELTWPSVSGRVYSVEWTPSLSDQDFSVLATNIIASPPINSVTLPAAERNVFYRLTVGRQ